MRCFASKIPYNNQHIIKYKQVENMETKYKKGQHFSLRSMLFLVDLQKLTHIRFVKKVFPKVIS